MYHPPPRYPSGCQVTLLPCFGDQFQCQNWDLNWWEFTVVWFQVEYGKTVITWENPIDMNGFKSLVCIGDVYSEFITWISETFLKKTFNRVLFFTHWILYIWHNGKCNKYQVLCDAKILGIKNWNRCLFLGTTQWF